MLPTNSNILLQRVDSLNREMERLRRDILKGMAGGQPVYQQKKSLFGSVSAGEITDEMITRAQKSLFRTLDDLK